MSNKLFGDNVKDYLVEGAKNKGYLKNSGKGFGDGSTSTTNTDYNGRGGPNKDVGNWFEGKKGNKGVTQNRKLDN